MFIQLNGVRHHYVSKGEGPPVVLVHGLGGTLNAWYGVLENLSLHHHVVALDLRGHGRSDDGDKAVSIPSLAADVEALIAALELPAVTLVGHSMGTLVAQQLAATRPEIVDNLVLVGGISHFEPPAKDAYVKRAEMVEADGMDALVDDWIPGALAPRTRAKLPQLVGLLREMFLRNQPAAYARACQALAKAPSISHTDIGQPTLLLVGDHDRSTPIAMTEELHRLIPVSQVRVIAGAAHWAALEQPDALAAAILEYLT
ncbi:MAG: alpha/beta hydrolase [Actinomycetota bacterium]|jgi:pimeloyl-ACP methyl ester carboxylesterase|nr:alpha/beta fold hydrolase [Euzebyaceae bacterium]MDQ3451858.1 alpha/beta hydrolase [Actinomycetota bacterium]